MEQEQSDHGDLTSMTIQVNKHQTEEDKQLCVRMSMFSASAHFDCDNSTQQVEGLSEAIQVLIVIINLFIHGLQLEVSIPTVLLSVFFLQYPDIDIIVLVTVLVQYPDYELVLSVPLVITLTL